MVIRKEEKRQVRRGVAMIMAMIFVVLVVPSAIAQDKSPSAYLCIADMSTGFKYKDGRWQSASFDVTDHKYILRRTKESDSSLLKDAAWVWGELGDEYMVRCKTTSPESKGFISCEDIAVNVTVNVNSLSFQIIQDLGYVRSDRDYGEDSSTPFLEIGKCSPL